jgi:hypothetical protein
MNFKCHIKERKRITIGLLPKKIFRSLNKPMDSFPSIYSNQKNVFEVKVDSGCIVATFGFKQF